ncbi:2-keto-4-pentenoate hydratase [Falsirhodobacter halotolerans]|uniref:2-keto-4-pentenoate hydratase n=1 Tax=Falsirhodobacter halotolerans TaxID=1146892 RepID=UPI001FD22EA5|nr:fumarylacetoacetate hydrolase family protein [Falsirhodobacter halotolerans]MCJ8141088.1 hypothetical protein [Falsirhodobacter halotolerans]
MTHETPTQTAARLLRDAEHGSKLAHLPEGVAPTDEAAAYAVQDAVLAGQRVAAWKVAAIRSPEPLQTAPLTRDMMIESTLPSHIREPEIEVEIAIALVSDLPPREADYTREEVIEALGKAHAAIEIVESRFAVRKEAAPLSALADKSSSAGVVIGSGTDAWRDLDFTTLNVTLTGAEPIAEAKGNATQEQTINSLIWLANHASRRGLGLMAGQYVITGARIGPMVVKSGQRLMAGVEGIGEVTLAV